MVDEGPAVDDVTKDDFKIITALSPKLMIYDRWVETLAKHMPKDRARKIAAELVDEAFAAIEEDDE